MSEFINNRTHRKEVLKQIIHELHQGKTIDEVQAKFQETFGNVSASEITEAEQALIDEGLPVSEIQRLCDVHSAVFKGSIEEIHAEIHWKDVPGHPANVLVRENKAIEQLIELDFLPLLETLDYSDIPTVKELLGTLSLLDIHYSRKENLLFPYMEKYGITAPPKVMWGVDDEIRADLKSLLARAEEEALDLDAYKKDIEVALERVTEMVFKEENILLPMLMETLSEEEWKKIHDESADIGYIVANIPEWNPIIASKEDSVPNKEFESNVSDNTITFPTGVLKAEEIIKMLDALPLDITFVDKDDTVKYFSQGKERIFTRTKAVIGRNVANCHPPGSVHIVEEIVSDFKSGKKDHEDFWIPMKDMFVYIRYFAVRSDDGAYLGTLEVTQNIKPIQALAGSKRLVSE